ncbi:MAG: putative toxin-antitoxin system toxin component, PIN family [Pseudobdellovibrionaceae bacterium]
MAKKLVVVLDTNVFVSGLISPNGVPGAILQRFRQGEFEIATSKSQIREIQEVLKRPSLVRALHYPRLYARRAA